MPLDHDPLNAECLYGRPAIDRMIETQAALMNVRYRDSRPLVLSVMTGALVYAGQLLPHLSFALDLDYVHATRYDGERSGGTLHWIAQPRESIAGRSILLLDDILDEGITLQAILDWLETQGAADIAIAVLTLKEKPVLQPCQPSFPALTVPDCYVYGFGLDADGLWRNANGIFVAPDSP